MPHSAALQHHHTPSGVLLAVLVALAILYAGWRMGWLGRLRAGQRARRLRDELNEQRISPVSLIPLAVLVVVVVLLIVNH